MTCCFSSSPASSSAVNIWTDTFTAFSGSTYPDYVNNGRWGDSIYRWSARSLPANGDKQYWVNDGNDFGGGTMGAMLTANGGWGSAPFLHVQSGSSLRLRAYPLTVSEANTYVFGYRYIAGALVDCTPPLAISGQNYGTWTIRFRFNSFGKGQHLAIWLLPDDSSWPPEIDILEVINGESTWHCNLHSPSGGDAMTDFTRPGNASDWYTAAFTLSPTLMTWKINGATVREQSNMLTEKRYAMHITWEIGTNWTGDPDGTTPWPADFEIDFITLDSLS